MLREENIAIEIKSQGYECKTYTANVEGTEAVLLFESRQRTADMRCPVCGSTVHIYDSGSMNLRDMPIWVGCKQELCFIMHRYTPEMNPIEQIWKQLRSMGFRNEVFKTLEHVVTRLCLTICQLTNSIVKSITCRHWIECCFLN